MTAWTCDAHRVITTDDCPKCDDELIALTEQALGRVRALADEWAVAGGSHRRNADLIRAAIDGEEA